MSSLVQQPDVWKDEYWRVSDDDQRYEYINGRMYVTPYTSSYENHEIRHYLSKATAHLNNDVINGFRVAFPALQGMVEPDLMILPKVRKRVVDYPDSDKDRFHDYLVEIPQLIVEINSGDSYRTDHIEKFHLYEAAGVPEYWIVNPRAFSVTVWTLQDGMYQLFGEFVEEEVITSPLITGLEIRTRSLFLYYSRER